MTIESRFPTLAEADAEGCDQIDVSITFKPSMSDAAKCDALDARAERLANPADAEVEREILGCGDVTERGNVLTRRYYAKAKSQ